MSWFLPRPKYGRKHENNANPSHTIFNYAMQTIQMRPKSSSEEQKKISLGVREIQESYSDR